MDTLTLFAGNVRRDGYRELWSDATLECSYSIIMAEGILEANSHLIAEVLKSRSALLVTTPSVYRLCGARLQTLLSQHGINLPELVLSCTERTKSLAQVEEICASAYRHNLGRTSVLIGLGGGVCTDLVTMAASMYRRGIAYVRIPTTLIGQVDAGIGIKGAVNFAGKKSGLGCFYAPERVLIDSGFLASLPPAHISAGLAEILKVALVRDQVLFGIVEAVAHELVAMRLSRASCEVQTILRRSVAGMLEELQPNLYERRSYRRLMDFGHTFGPALEASSGFGMSHGESVAVDMALTCALGVELGLLRESDLSRVIELLLASRLPIYSPLLTVEMARHALRSAAEHRGGCVHLVVPTGIGCATFIDSSDAVPSRALASAIDVLRRLNSQTTYYPATTLPRAARRAIH